MKHLRILTAGAGTITLLASAPGFATAPSGLGVNGIVNGHYGTLTMNTAGDKTGQWGLILKTLADTDMGVDEVSLTGSGYTGWHAHPGPVFVTVTQGSIKWYDGSNPLCTPHTYSEGQSFIEPAYKIHNAVNNSSSVTAIFVAMTIKPVGFVGPAFVLDRAEPNNCKF
jgi:quercetin dioxygenase-like cupin family protein